MKPIPFKEQSTVIAKDQPQYLPLPVHIGGTPTYVFTSCWKLTWKERWKAFWTGKIYIGSMTYGRPLQPLQAGSTFESISK